MVKLGYFPDCSCLGLALQESLEKGYKPDNPTRADDGGIHPDYRQALHNLLSKYVEVGLGVKGESEVQAQRPSNFVAAILRCLMHLWPLRRRPPARRFLRDPAGGTGAAALARATLWQGGT